MIGSAMKRGAFALTAVGALAVTAALPASAQEPLGFEVDRTEGAPGDQVNGQVNVDDVAEHCATDVETLQANFSELAVAINTSDEVSVDLSPEPLPIENIAVHLYLLLGAGVSSDPEAAEEALGETFVMTFAEVATQDPVGERVNYDPAVGEATVTVPDVEPGTWAVAGTCVAPSSDVETIQANLGPVEDYIIETLNLPGEELDNMAVFFDALVDHGYDNHLIFAEEHASELLLPIMEPRALGAEIFCVLDTDGDCPDGSPADPADPSDPSDPETPAAPGIPGDPSLTG